jgi:hypothetical protein
MFRFFLELKIGDKWNEFDFFVLDEVVMKLAPLTCNELGEKVTYLFIHFYINEVDSYYH